jgi:hypothetical protein
MRSGAMPLEIKYFLTVSARSADNFFARPLVNSYLPDVWKNNQNEGFFQFNK